MLYNKNKVSKTNDKKILHKVGKQWKVVSVALLMAVAGGALATHAANADSVNDVNTDPYAANQAYYNPTVKPATQKQSAASSANSSVGYYPAESGKAASYFDNVDKDNALAASKFSLVNTYVQSLNNEYNPQVNSYSAKSASASSAAAKDAKLASSYSATNQKAATSSVVNSLAATHHMPAAAYQNMVMDNEETFSNEVSSASADVKAANDVQSLATKLATTDLSAASLSASVASVTAESNVNGAQAVFDSVTVGTKDNGAGSYINIANQLSAGVSTLLAAGNPLANDAHMSMLLTDNNLNSAEKSNYQSEASVAVSGAVKSAQVSLSDMVSAKDLVALSSYASSGAFNNLMAKGGADALTSEYNGAVSEAVDYQFAGYMSSVATSLYGHYNPQYLNSQALSASVSAATASASAALRSAKIAASVAKANYGLVTTFANAVDAAKAAGMSTADAEVEALNSKMGDNVVDYVLSRIGAIQWAGYRAGKYDDVESVNPSEFMAYFVGKDGVLVNTPTSTKDVATFKELVNELVPNYSTNSDSAAWKKVFNLTDVNALATAKNTNLKSATGTPASWTDDEAVNGMKSFLANFELNLNNQLNNAVDAAADAQNHGNDGADGLYLDATQAMVPNSWQENANTSAVDAALLSDGVNVDQLLAESGAVQNVLNTASSAANSSSDLQKQSSAAKFADALSVAASSANSALTSTENASSADSSANDEDVTLASYFATSYSNEANSESALSTKTSSELNEFFQNMADDPTFNAADNVYSGAEAAAANDKKMGVAYAKVVYNKSAHFLDVLKGAKLHASYNFGGKDDKVLGSVNKGDRLTVLGVNFNRNGKMHGATRYLVLDNNTKKKGFFTAQPQYSKAAYLSATADHANVSVKLLKPVNVFNQLDGGKAVKTLKAGTVVNGVTVVRDNPDDDAMGFTKVETAEPEDDFFTANTNYVELVTPQVTNNQPSDYAFNLSNINLAKAYNNDSQY